jgi:hypothetical protein
MQLEPIIQILEDAQLGQSGRTLFVGGMPASVRRGILLRGKLTGSQIDWNIPGRIKTGFQAIVRSEDVPEGQALAKAVAAALTFSDKQVDGMWLEYVRPKHLPIQFPNDEGGFTEFSINFDSCLCLDETL